MSKKILITGGAGFIGHQVIKELLQSTDWQLLVIDRFIASIKKGGKVLNICHPTLPVKTSPGRLLVIFISLVAGGIIGFIFIFINKFVIDFKK